ncbi:glycerophosphodiester phosphodiesterase family protein [Gramella lutea]|uniref:Glycerophosphodiester phosphodiesterase family protein n=1 Tax=Christiangramia lutea TaxID=1607951 RepID=A0A9X2A9C4_9FLAO|nr:glycerophosphodiester phosphodiesterase family protein [Christiangramia lutea]MCH4823240.1 glycerophosphodiester phosphodiesterase family protein [Christiangramia lutea]
MKRKLKIYYSSSFILLLIILGLWNPFHIGIDPKDYYKEGDTILVAAHRGSHASHPENSISAIKESIKNEIDIVEIDIRQTKDHELVLLHDHSLDRTTTGTEPLSDYTLKKLQQFNLKFKNKITIEKIPTLEEVLEIAKDKCILNLDFKTNDFQAFKRAADLISKNHMEESVIISVNDLNLLPKLHAYNREIRLMPIAFKRRQIKKILEYDFIDIIQVYHRAYNKQLLKRIEEKEMMIWVNSLKKYDKIQAKGKPGFYRLLKIKKVDVIQTDYPEELLSMLREIDLHP